MSIELRDRYEVIADEAELEWFFNNVIQKPLVCESYSAVFCARYKKLTPEERQEVGISKREAEFLATQTFSLKKIHDIDNLAEEDSWTFERFVKRLRRFNVDSRAYLTTGGYPLPDKCLATIFYVNPCDEIKVADEVMTKTSLTKTAIIKAMLNGKCLEDNIQSFQTFGNLENNIKHARAHCKGSVYWLDYDIDVPSWFKNCTLGIVKPDRYFEGLKAIFNEYFGKGTYVIVDTSGGYHVLVRTRAIHQNPHFICQQVEDLYKRGCLDGNPEYRDEHNNEKFECIVNDSQIPGLPLPGTFQYGRLVRVINKEEFNPSF